MMRTIADKLKDGKPFTSFETYSCKPFFKAFQRILCLPTTIADIEIGNIVICKHVPTYGKVIKKSKTKGILIEDNTGSIVGWTKILYGRIMV